jgi:hypothetical protein
MKFPPPLADGALVWILLGANSDLYKSYHNYPLGIPAIVTFNTTVGLRRYWLVCINSTLPKKGTRCVLIFPSKTPPAR